MYLIGLYSKEANNVQTKRRKQLIPWLVDVSGGPQNHCIAMEDFVLFPGKYTFNDHSIQRDMFPTSCPWQANRTYSSLATIPTAFFCSCLNLRTCLGLVTINDSHQQQQQQQQSTVNSQQSTTIVNQNQQ